MRKTVLLLINNTDMKNFARKCFLKPFFFTFEKTFFRVSFKLFVIALPGIIGLQISHCLPANHNPELRCVICTGITL